MTVDTIAAARNASTAARISRSAGVGIAAVDTGPLSTFALIGPGNNTFIMQPSQAMRRPGQLVQSTYIL